MSLRFDVAVVTHDTDDLLLALLASLSTHLPASARGEVHVWDNASTDRTAEMLAMFAGEAPWLHVHRSETNVHHGPALDALLREHATAEWVLVLDSDTELRSNFVPDLPPLAPGPPAFVGQLQPDQGPLYAYLAHLLVHRPSYLRLPPFRHHGAPGVDYFHAIAARGWPYARFRFSDHVDHLGQGTLRRVYARNDRGNEFFAFAARESERRPASAERRAHEAERRRRLDAFLVSGRVAVDPSPSPSPLRSVTDASPRTFSFRSSRPVVAVGRLLPPGWRAGRAVRSAARLGLRPRPEHAAALFRRLAARRPRRALELGTGYGGLLALLTRAAAGDAVVVSVDDPPWERDDPGEPDYVARLGRLCRARQSLHLVRGDLRRPEASRQIEAVLPSEPIDVLIVDTSRTHDASSWAPRVAAGGLLVIHGLPGPEGQPLWEDARSRGCLLGADAPPAQRIGIVER